MEINLAHGAAQQRARRIAKRDHGLQSLRIGRQLALAAAPQRLVDTRHEEDQLHETRALDDIAKAVDPVVSGTIGHHKLTRAGDMDKTGIAATWRSIDAA